MGQFGGLVGIGILSFFIDRRDGWGLLVVALVWAAALFLRMSEEEQGSRGLGRSLSWLGTGLGLCWVSTYPKGLATALILFAGSVVAAVSAAAAGLAFPRPARMAGRVALTTALAAATLMGWSIAAGDARFPAPFCGLSAADRLMFGALALGLAPALLRSLAWIFRGGEEDAPLDLARLGPARVRNFPAPPAPASAGGPAESLVESGAFRIDADKALAKLGRFQLAHPHDFAVCWLRCAVASGARTIEARAAGGDFELRFDGSPLEASLLKDPRSGILGEQGEAGRHLAAGLLGLLRLRPAGILVRSGTASWGLGQEWGRNEDARTVLWARLPARFGWSPARRAARRLKSAFGLAGDARLVVDDAYVPPEPAAGPWPVVRFEGPGGRGVVSLPEDGDPRSLVGFYVLGAEVGGGSREALPSALRVRARLAGDLGLNASLDGVVRDERFAGAMRQLEEQARALIHEAVQAQWRRYEELVRGAFSGGDTLAAGLFQKLTAWPFLPEGLRRVASISPAFFEFALWEEKVCAWLRECAASPSVSGTGRFAEERKALWRVPLFLTVGLDPVPLAEIRRLHSRLGRIPWADPGLVPILRGKPRETLWLPSARQRDCLARIFPGQLRKADVSVLR